MLRISPLIGGDHFPSSPLRAHIETPLRAEALASPARDAVFRVLYHRFFRGRIQPQYIHRAAGHTRPAPRALLRVKIPYNHMELLDRF